jgi:hypothetical protein
MREFRWLAVLPSRASRILAIAFRLGRNSCDLAVEFWFIAPKPEQETLARSEPSGAIPENMRVVVSSATLGAQAGID